MKKFFLMFLFPVLAFSHSVSSLPASRITSVQLKDMTLAGTQHSDEGFHFSEEGKETVSVQTEEFPAEVSEPVMETAAASAPSVRPAERTAVNTGTGTAEEQKLPAEPASKDASAQSPESASTGVSALPATLSVGQSRSTAVAPAVVRSNPQTLSSASDSGSSIKVLTAPTLHGTNHKTSIGYWSTIKNEIDTFQKTMIITETKTYEDGRTVTIVDTVSNFTEENYSESVPQNRTITTTDSNGNTSTQTYNWAPRGGDDDRYMVVDQSTGNEVAGADPTSTGPERDQKPEESIDSY